MTAGERLSRLWWVPLLLAPALWLGDQVVQPAGFPFLPGAQYSDLLISHWPTAWLIRHSIMAWGQVPLWNPNILSGMPLAADPLSGMWYPPQWVTVLLPSAQGFNLFFFAHLVWAGLGMAGFMRQLGAGRWAMLFCGLAFGGLAKTVGHVGLGHVGMVAGLSWVPWFLWALNQAIHSTDALHARRWYALSAGAYALAFLADPRWALPAAALGLGWWTRCAIPLRGETRPDLKVHVPSAALGGSLAVMLSAPLLLPLGELARLSTRSSLGVAEAAALSLPPVRLLSLLDPGAAGTPEWQAYVGLIVLFLAGLALILRLPGWGFWAGEVAISLVWSLGSFTPIYPILSQLVPGALALRVPSRMLFLMAFGLIVLAGLGLQALTSGGIAARGPRWVRLWGLGLIVLGGTYELAGSLLGAEPIRWLTLLSALAVGVLAFGAGRSMRITPWGVAALLAVLVLDLAAINLAQLESRPAASVLTEGQGRVQQVLGISGPDGRGFSPSYSLPQQTAARLSLGIADGVHPIQLRAYRDFMAAATGFSSTGYSVTLPPFPSGDPAENWGARLQLDQLGLLGVGAIASEFPVPGLEAIGLDGGGYLYANPAVRPRAWVEPQGGAAGDWVPVDAWSWTPNTIGLTAEGPGRLVLSEIGYPGWDVHIDGKPVAIESAHDLLRATDLPPGEHRVVFEFRPRWVMWGMGLGVMGVLLLGLVWWPR